MNLSIYGGEVVLLHPPCPTIRAFSLAYQIVLNFSQNLGTIYKQDDALFTFCYNVEAIGDTFAAGFGDTI